MAPNSKKTGGWLPRGPGTPACPQPGDDRATPSGTTPTKTGLAPCLALGQSRRPRPPPSSPQRWQRPCSFPHPSGVPARDLPAHPRPSLHLVALPGEATKTAVPPGCRLPGWGAHGLKEGDGARGDVHRDQRGASPCPTRRGAPPAGRTPSTQMPRTGLGDWHAGPSGNGRLSPAHGALVVVTVTAQAGRSLAPRAPRRTTARFVLSPPPTSSPPASASPSCL
ncbi:unnamed protein product [Nyctereutes procyonoides]|uniref:(raccoon dog) hypothetical protein n=1 Tax=Nyctereutes procyonoides TaxID=34880 RepID=A0A811Y1M2_NYCPR|nr:unnamed protein product [Nyctereutes procyonoides]